MRPATSLATTRLFVGVLAGCAGAGACAPFRLPAISPLHPASPAAPDGQIAAVPSVLDVSRAVVRDPAEGTGAMLHPDMPMQEGGGDASGHGHHHP